MSPYERSSSRPASARTGDPRCADRQPAVERERRGGPEDRVVVGQVPRGAGRGHGEEDGERTPAQPDRGDHRQRSRRRDHLHVQPGQRRGQEGGGHGGRHRWRTEEERQSPAGRQRRRHFGVDVEGIERNGRAQGGQPGDERRLAGAARLRGEPPRDDGHAGPGQRQDDDAEEPAPGRVERGQHQRQSRAVGRERPSIRPGGAEMRQHRPRRVLTPVLAREVVGEVQVAFAPEALRHEQVVGLVAGHAQPRRVPEPHRDVQHGGSREEGARPGSDRAARGRGPSGQRTVDGHRARDGQRDPADRPARDGERRAARPPRPARGPPPRPPTATPSARKAPRVSMSRFTPAS